MKISILATAIISLAIPSMAMAQPANYMIDSKGNIHNLDHLWGKGVTPVSNPVAPTPIVRSAPNSISFELESLRLSNERLRRDINNQRAFDGARRQLGIR